jgi:hypothetical protein
LFGTPAVSTELTEDQMRALVQVFFGCVVAAPLLIAFVVALPIQVI